MHECVWTQGLDAVQDFKNSKEQQHQEGHPSAPIIFLSPASSQGADPAESQGAGVTKALLTTSSAGAQLPGSRRGAPDICVAPSNSFSKKMETSTRAFHATDGLGLEGAGLGAVGKRGRGMRQSLSSQNLLGGALFYSSDTQGSCDG